MERSSSSNQSWGGGIINDVWRVDVDGGIDKSSGDIITENDEAVVSERL